MDREQRMFGQAISLAKVYHGIRPLGHAIVRDGHASNLSSAVVDLDKTHILFAIRKRLCGLV